MRALLRFRLVLACVILAVTGSIALHALTRPAAPGPSVSWASPAPAVTPPAGAGPAGIPRASATPSASGGAEPFSGLRAPLTTLLQRLNGDTAHEAAGQQSIIDELEAALRDRAEQFLDWVVSRR
jgi:hypothetical protein